MKNKLKKILSSISGFFILIGTTVSKAIDINVIIGTQDLLYGPPPVVDPIVSQSEFAIRIIRVVGIILITIIFVIGIIMYIDKRKKDKRKEKESKNEDNNEK